MRSSSRFFLLVGFLLLLFGLTWLDGRRLNSRAGEARNRTGDLVRNLELTDLALFTEARYTRHPSQADLHSAFQDHPMALEHFPSGSLMAPPSSLER